MVTKSGALVQTWDCNYNKFCIQKLPTSLLMTSLKRKQILKYTHISNIIKTWLFVKSEYYYVFVTFMLKVTLLKFKFMPWNSLKSLTYCSSLSAASPRFPSVNFNFYYNEPSDIASIQNTVSVFLVELSLIWPNNFVSHHKCRFKLF